MYRLLFDLINIRVLDVLCKEVLRKKGHATKGRTLLLAVLDNGVALMLLAGFARRT